MKLRINRSRAGRVRLDRVRVRRSWSAAVVACFGLFLASAGVGLTATAANAAPKDNGPKVIVCHATNSDTNPYDYKDVGASSTDYKAHLKHRNDPQQTWKKGTWFLGEWHAAGSAKPDLIDGLDAGVTKRTCDAKGSNVLLGASASIRIVQQPACDNNGVGRWEASAAGATVNPASGTGGSDSAISATATAEPGYQFPGGSATKTLTGAFGTYDPESCGQVQQPLPTTVNATFVDATCEIGGVVSYATEGEHVTWKMTGTKAPGGTVTVTATPDEGYVIDGKDSFTHTYPEFDAQSCSEVDPPMSTEVGVTFSNPTCENGGVASYSTEGEHVTWAMTGTKAPGGTVTVTATPVAGYVISGAKSFTHDYPAFDADGCGQVQQPLPTTVNATFVDATCENGGVVSYATEGEHVTWKMTGTKAPGGTVTVTATPVAGYVISGTKSFTHSFTGAPECGDTVLPPSEPPVDETPGEGSPEQPPVVGPVKEPVVLAPAPAAPAPQVKGPQVKAAQGSAGTVIPTLVKAGLPGTSAASATAPGSSIGSALTGVGLMFLAMAGGIAFIGRRRERV